MEDGLTPRERQLLASQSGLSERLLLLLALRDSATLSQIAALLEIPRPELMHLVGGLSERELVAHRQQVDEPGLHWHLTAKGRRLGGDLHEQALRSQPRLSTLEAAATAPPAEAEQAAEPQRSPLSKRRRVVMSEREQQGFSWE